MNRFQNAYFFLMIIALVVTFSPLKAAAYLLPFAGFILLVFLGHRWDLLRNLIIIGMGFIVLTLFHAAFGPPFLWQNAILWLLTHGALFFLLAVPTRGLYSEELMAKTIRVAVFFLVFESLWGIGQAFQGYAAFGSFDGAIGDYVSGTISPFAPARSFSNPIFAVNIAVLVMFASAAGRKSKKTYLGLILGTLALLFTSVLHLILLFFVAFGLSQLILRRWGFRRTFLVASVGLSLFTGLLLTQRTNLGLYQTYAELILENRLPKVEITRRVVMEIAPQDPLFAFFGYGPGQFVSRAGLMGSGRYLGSPENPRKLPLIPAEISVPVRLHVLDLWEESLTQPGFGGSAMAKPWYSWLVVGSELGLVGLMSTLALIGISLFRVVRSDNFFAQGQWGGFLVFVLLFFSGIGLVENYWETTQAVFVGILLGKLAFSKSVAPSETDDAPGILPTKVQASE
jgi:hypothetical protein